MDVNKETYLGDGVYAYHDGYQIWLRTEREGLIHEIALEPDVFSNLYDWNKKLIDQIMREKLNKENMNPFPSKEI